MNSPVPAPTPPPARLRPFVGPSLLTALALLAPEGRGEWTHYRGPSHDGTYAAPIRTNWTAQPPKLVWRRTVEPALSSITLRDGRLFTQARRRVGGADREFAVALEAATGRELWAVNLDLADYPNGGVGNDDGPRSTPVLDGDRVYVFTSYLKLYCLEAATGREIWKRDFPAELGSNVIEWQNAASPVIVGDLLFVNGNGSPNRLMAIRKSDGTTAWRKHDERMTQASPVAATIAGVPQVVFFTQAGLTGVRPETGDALWRLSLPYSTSTAASPVVCGNAVYGSAAYTSGSGAVRLSANGASVAAAQLWKKRNTHMNHWATPVHHDGYVYGVFGQSLNTLRCINVNHGAEAALHGTEAWRAASVGRSGDVGYGSVLIVNGHLFVLTESGEAILARLDPANYHEIDRFQAVRGKTWNNPAWSEGLLYARSTTEIAVWDLAPPAPPSPVRLAPSVEFANGRPRVTIRTADGSPIPPTRAASLSLLATDDLAVPVDQWTPIGATPVVVGNAVQIEDPAAASGRTRRYYRARENP